MENNKFNVLIVDFNTKEIVWEDVLPYFRVEWNEHKSRNKKEITNRGELKKWIEDKSRYQYWSRCQYEHIVLPWPFDQNNPLKESYKIDVHEQIMANIEIVTDILYKEFKIK